MPWKYTSAKILHERLEKSQRHDADLMINQESVWKVFQQQLFQKH